MVLPRTEFCSFPAMDSLTVHYMAHRDFLLDQNTMTIHRVGLCNENKESDVWISLPPYRTMEDSRDCIEQNTKKKVSICQTCRKNGPNKHLWRIVLWNPTHGTYTKDKMLSIRQIERMLLTPEEYFADRLVCIMLPEEYPEMEKQETPSVKQLVKTS